jgi:hypothetical protein
MILILFKYYNIVFHVPGGAKRASVGEINCLKQENHKMFLGNIHSLGNGQTDTQTSLKFIFHPHGKTGKMIPLTSKIYLLHVISGKTV